MPFILEFFIRATPTGMISVHSEDGCFWTIYNELVSIKLAPGLKDLEQGKKKKTTKTKEKQRGRDTECHIIKTNLLYKKWLLGHFKLHVGFAMLLLDSTILEKGIPGLNYEVLDYHQNDREDGGDVRE